MFLLVTKIITASTNGKFLPLSNHGNIYTLPKPCNYGFPSSFPCDAWTLCILNRKPGLRGTECKNGLYLSQQKAIVGQKTEPRITQNQYKSATSLQDVSYLPCLNQSHRLHLSKVVKPGNSIFAVWSSQGYEYGWSCRQRGLCATHQLLLEQAGWKRLCQNYSGP